MDLVPVQASAGFITLAEAKDHLRIDPTSTDHDTELTLLIATACGLIEGRDGFTGRAFARQQWDMRLAAHYFGARRRFDDTIPLPLPPLISVDSITYRDATGVHVFDPANYFALGMGGVTPGRVFLNTGVAWPSGLRGPDALTVRFTAGCIDNAGNPAIPPPVKAAALLVIGTMFDNRESASDPLAGAPTALLAQFRS